jgi:hypothetical protein
MCTVTAIRSVADAADGHPWSPSGRRRKALVRIACNRDESRSRPPALPPQIRRFGDRRAILPIDPVSDGTWIAVNDVGLAATLLNVFETPGRSNRVGPAGVPLASRGTIVPGLMSCSTLDEAVLALRALDPSNFPPFRVVVLDEHRYVQARSNGTTVEEVAIGSLDASLMVTSSGLGDSVVFGPRNDLFNEMVCKSGDPPALQDEFHRHRWPDRPHLSVYMSRAEACTVSFSVVEIQPSRVALTYYPNGPCDTHGGLRLELPRAGKS